jgi:cobaltochelatase CobS
MGFKSNELDIQMANFNRLANYQARALADFMFVFRQMEALPNREEQRKFLREACLKPENVERARIGWRAIVLRKDPNDDAGKTPVPPAEERMLTTVSRLIEAHDKDVGAVVDAAVAEKTLKAEKRLNETASSLRATLKDEVNTILKEAAEKAKPIVIKDGAKLRKVEGVLPAEFTKMVQLANARIPILLVGPAGCGKTYLCEKLGEALGLETSDQSCSEGMSESVFNGLLLPIGKGGEFKHVPSPFMSRYEEGGVMLLDEMDAGDSNLFTYINKAIANSSYTVAQRWTDPVVKKHKDFVLVAAANTFGHGADSMYVGRNQLDAATLDRFKVGLITMDYSREVESSLAPVELCEWAWRIRDAIRVNKLRRVMSTRVIKDLAVMTEMHDWGRKEWDEAYFTGWSADDRRMAA